MFWKEVSYAHQTCIYLLKNTHKKYWNIITMTRKLIVFYLSIL